MLIFRATVTKFVKVMPRILWPLFYRTRCRFVGQQLGKSSCQQLTAEFCKLNEAWK